MEIILFILFLLLRYVMPTTTSEPTLSNGNAQQRTTKRGGRKGMTYKSYPKNELDDAIKACLENRMSYGAASKHYKVPKGTLHRHVEKRNNLKRDCKMTTSDKTIKSRRFAGYSVIKHDRKTEFSSDSDYHINHNDQTTESDGVDGFQLTRSNRTKEPNKGQFNKLASLIL